MKELSFKTRARVVRALGDKLVSGEIAALIELVKNSYDADASYCKIKISPEEKNIIIEDDGHGMTAEDIINSWSEIGVTNKHFSRESRIKKRIMLGAKGIGRLAAAKLGEKLEIISTAEKNGELSTFKIYDLDWSKFSEEADCYLDEVKFKYEQIDTRENAGTFLKIKNIFDVWNEDKLKKLVLELRKMLSPFKKDIDFDIFLDLSDFKVNKYSFDGYQIVNGTSNLFSYLENKNRTTINKIEPLPILDACHYSFEGEYKDSDISGIFKINDANESYNIKITLPNKKEVSCGSGLIYLHIFDRDTRSVKNVFKNTNLTINEGKTLLNEISGIAVYRNDFRIRPYGDKNFDWLNLDKRRVQNPSLRIEQAQVSGTILIEDKDETGLFERSSREEFEYNDNYDFFKEIIISVFAEIEPIRQKYNDRIGKNRLSQKDKDKSAFEKLKKEVKLQHIEKYKKYIPKEHQDEFDKDLDHSSKQLDKYISYLQERQSFLEANHALGSILSEVLHEARHPTSAIGADIIYLTDRTKNKWKDNIDDIIRTKLLEIFDNDIIHIETLENLYKRLDPLMRTNRPKSRLFKIHKPIFDSFLIFKNKLDKYEVEFKINEYDKNIDVFGVETDITTALINLIDNSLYWFDRRGVKKPKIYIKTDEDEDNIYLYFSDNAGGVLESLKDRIFIAGVTGKQEGTGLGLSIAREALGRSGYDIYQENDKEGAVFTIVINKCGEKQ